MPTVESRQRRGLALGQSTIRDCPPHRRGTWNYAAASRTRLWPRSAPSPQKQRPRRARAGSGVAEMLAAEVYVFFAARFQLRPYGRIARCDRLPSA